MPTINVNNAPNKAPNEAQSEAQSEAPNKAPASPLPTPAQTPVVALERATFRHPGGHGIQDVTLELPPGVILGLLGPNGAGKTTILSLVAGFRAPQDGSVHVFGASLADKGGDRLRARVGVLFQDASLDPLMSVRETLWLHGRLFGLPGRNLRPRIDELLTLIGLSDRRSDAVETLSGGMRRRLELARAILHRPDLVILDEPTLALDPDSKAALWALLHAVNAAGTALLLATNDVAEAERQCHAVALLDAGRVVRTGAPADLKRDLRRDSVRVEWPDPPPGIETTLAAWDGVGAVTRAAPDLHVTVDDASAFVPRLFALAQNGIRAVQIHESTLEDAYFQAVRHPFSPAASGDEIPAAGGEKGGANAAPNGRRRPPMRK